MDFFIKHKQKIIIFLLVTITTLILSIPFFSLTKAKNAKTVSKDLQIVTTSTMLKDLVKHLVGDVVEEENKNKYNKIKGIQVDSLMGVGIDPHNYKTKLSDRKKIKEADLVVINGLHLEAKMAEAFPLLTNNSFTVVQLDEANTKVINQKGKEDERIKEGDIKRDEDTHGPDPHIWFDIDLWIKVLHQLKYKLKTALVKDSRFRQSDIYNLEHNCQTYAHKLKLLHKYVGKKFKALKEHFFSQGKTFILVTAHDAFSYLARKYDFELSPIQGISTQTEASISDIEELANKLVNNQVKAIFVESSFPEGTLDSLKESVKSKGHNIKKSDEELYADALGSESEEPIEFEDDKDSQGNPTKYKHSTYIGALLHNIHTIEKELKQ
ncbi:ABC-type metal transport system, substrate-binding protein SitA [Candidatus Phytoplasma asteris]|uniref:ABC-type Mn/Zn transport system, periplasmic Mn/Zn-binding protein n=3 Tax=16SrI (Aster yellows group) TaxID=3042590 RepID=Q2NIK2_AYWBP|nr:MULTISPECIES: zinc ABC transporter substrate-binding protein [16SrI (Aster yellows group)]ABC65741.1 ABC-type Mn/Zn transport system, periplasmic Mn/Zn-binding protein [Aster yellows witches'-broom phytoplasma AYWB]PEH36117.1 zinc ABC transporter substrate-binding protein [New Jersey aster yellows phytoplasma]